MSFDPSQHLRKVKGNQEYLEVRYRLMWLRDIDPEARVSTMMVGCEVRDKDGKKDPWYAFHARVEMTSGRIGEGHGSCYESEFRAGAMEKSETKALGRALAACGLGTQWAIDREEAESGDTDDGALADSPVARKSTTKPTPPPTTSKPTLDPAAVARINKIKDYIGHTPKLGEIRELVKEHQIAGADTSDWSTLTTEVLDQIIMSLESIK